tara:strand:- start:3605 stop:4411 length:807 start_codon:yes stop_codon:yes gene_type:complete
LNFVLKTNLYNYILSKIMQEIYIDDIGEGYPLVLVHGYLGSSEMWKFQKEYLSKYFRVISPALPGFGESYNAKSLNSINLMARFILKIVDNKNIKEFNLMGHSMGGMIVQEIAKIIGNRINKLICFATGPIGDIPGRFEPINKSIDRLQIEGIKDHVRRIPPNWFVEGKTSKNYFLCEKATQKVSEETAQNALIAMRDWNGLNNLKNIKNKTLIIWGDKDKSYNYEQISLLKKFIKNSNLKIFKGSCHNVHLEEPKKFNKIVKEFLNK